MNTNTLLGIIREHVLMCTGIFTLVSLNHLPVDLGLLHNIQHRDLDM